MSTDHSEPRVIIVGGGPCGLLAALKLSKLGIKSTVLERSSQPDQWSTRSYTIVLDDKGKNALEEAGCLEYAMARGSDRKYIYLYDGVEKGVVKAIPKSPPGLGFTRPLLVECLEKIISEDHQSNITLKRGINVQNIVKNVGSIQVHLGDGTFLEASHVVGADGKWSKVRRSFPSLETQVTMRSCPSFGVRLFCPNVPTNWNSDGTYILRPQKHNLYYIIVSPRSNNLSVDGLCISMVCYDETIEKYPWLAPPEEKDGWKSEYSAMPVDSNSENPLAEHLEKLFQDELPTFYKAVGGRETLQSACVHHRVTWLEPLDKEEVEVNYSTKDGLVTLIGDAAHSMTPSIGAGCNTALESAVKLVDAIRSVSGENKVDSFMLSQGFLQYGASRPSEAIPVQKASAARSCLKQKQ